MERNLCKCHSYVTYSADETEPENPWYWLKRHHLANRTFESVDEIINAACDAWNDFTAQPGLI